MDTEQRHLDFYRLDSREFIARRGRCLWRTARELAEIERRSRAANNQRSKSA